jgi:K+-sensing histidine kinase KdpD
VIGVLGVKPRIRQPALQTSAGCLMRSPAEAAWRQARPTGRPGRQAQIMQATEKLQTALLNSISHDLRTPW